MVCCYILHDRRTYLKETIDYSISEESYIKMTCPWELYNLYSKFWFSITSKQSDKNNRLSCFLGIDWVRCYSEIIRNDWFASKKLEEVAYGMRIFFGVERVFKLRFHSNIW